MSSLNAAHQDANTAHALGLDTPHLGAECAVSFPPMVRHGESRMPDHRGPFIVHCNEFRQASLPVFECYGDAVAHAEWLARSSPGFLYYILAPVAAIVQPPPQPNT